MILVNNVSPSYFILNLGWAKSAVCEKTLNDLVASSVNEQRLKARDSPSNLLLPPTIRSENMKEIVINIEEALASTGTKEEKQVILRALK
jgi:hypothetical protein